MSIFSQSRVPSLTKCGFALLLDLDGSANAQQGYLVPSSCIRSLWMTQKSKAVVVTDKRMQLKEKIGQRPKCWDFGRLNEIKLAKK